MHSTNMMEQNALQLFYELVYNIVRQKVEITFSFAEKICKV